MRLKHRYFYAICLLACLGTVAVGAEDDAVPAAETKKPAVSSVAGTVTSESEIPLSEMVVYLESPDADRKMPPVPEAVTVSQKGAQFNPRLVVVTVGQTVNFPNDEDRP